MIHLITFPRGLIVALVCVLLIILLGGNWFYQSQERQIQGQAEDELLAVAQLKVDQIVTWRAERLANAAVLTESLYFIDGTAQWLAAPQSDPPDGLLSRFQALHEYYYYDDVLLVDPDGQVRLSLKGDSGTIHEETAQSLAESWRTHRPTMTDLHAGPADLPSHLDVVAPLFASTAPDAEPIGAVILRTDAGQYLYPLIQSWPAPSDSSETLLVRRDGDDVLFLNDLRHQSNTALALRIPLTETEVPAVKVVLGMHGIFYGKDYRGVDVVSALLPIPDTPWYIVSKMDNEEVFADWHARSNLIMSLIVGLVVIVAVGGGMIWQRNKLVHYQHLFRAEKAQQESEARYQTTLLSIGDGVIVTDAEGRVVLFNPVAETLTGWSQQEAYGKPLEEVFPIVNEDTRLPVENPVHRALCEGIIVGLANHTLLLAKDGREMPIADSGAPICGPDGKLFGVVLVFRDQTAERVAQKALRASENDLKRSQAVAHVGHWTWNTQANQVTWSDEMYRIFGQDPDDFSGNLDEIVAASIHPDDKEAVDRANQAVLTEQTSAPLEYRVIWPDGSVRHVWAQPGDRVLDDQGKITTLSGIVQDITERKMTEEHLRRSETRYRSLFENMLNGFAYCKMIYDQGRPQDFIYLDVNAAFFESLTGLKNVVGKFVTEIIPGIREADPGLFEIYSRVALTGIPERFETYVAALEMWFSISVYSPEKEHFVAVFDVITERKRTELAEREQRMLAETLRDTAAALISAVGLDAVMTTILENVARVVPHDAANIMLIDGDYAQPAHWSGYSDELVPFVREFRISVVDAINLREMTTTSQTSLVSYTEQYPGWVQVPLTAWVKSYVGAPTRSRGQVVGFLNLDSGTPGFFTAIHAQRLQTFADQAAIAIENAQLYEEVQRRAAELEQRVVDRTAQLNHAKERIEAILNSSSDVMIMCRTDGMIDQVNPAFERVFKCEPGYAHNQPLIRLVAAENVRATEQVFATVIAARRPQRLEVIAHCEGHASFDADMVLSPIVERDGALLGVVCSLRDMTERKHAEAQLRQMLEQEMQLGELKSRYVAMAAHDLRNPLAAIQTAIDVFAKYSDRLTEDQKQSRYDRIRGSIQVMVAMLDDILTIGQVESGRLKFNPAPLEVISFCQNLVAEIRQVTHAPQVIDFSYQGDFVMVAMDAKLLRHILANLLSNAIKYSPDEGAIVFTVSCEHDETIFFVQDQGIGIPQADQARLFEAFHRSDNVGNIPGTGLGLAIVKQSVDLHGGTITFTSTEGIGTKFTVTIPQPPQSN